MREITMSTSALTRLFDYLPNPDDPEPVGPGGPVIRWLDWVSLNPQPLPPVATGFQRALFGPGPIPWGPSSQAWGPRPEPWRWAMLTRATISAHLDRLSAVGIIIVGGDVERAVQATSDSISSFVDDICGTPPHKGPFPGPWGPVLDSETLHPINVVTAGVQFQTAADALTDSTMHDVLERAAERLLDVGLSRLSEV